MERLEHLATNPFGAQINSRFNKFVPNTAKNGGSQGWVQQHNALTHVSSSGQNPVFVRVCVTDTGGVQTDRRTKLCL